jgi:hypothetical protein
MEEGAPCIRVYEGAGVLLEARRYRGNEERSRNRCEMEGAPCIWVYEGAGVLLEVRRYKNEHPVYYETGAPLLPWGLYVINICIFDYGILGW